MTTAKTGHQGLGLNSRQVAEAREKYGRNILTPPERPSVWKLYFSKYNDPVIRILLVAAALSAVIGFLEDDLLETLGIVIAILLATSIGFYFEYTARRRFDVLNALGQEELMPVVRDGNVTQIPRSEIVVGDVVILEQGMKVPADGVLIEAVELQMNESSLTGEACCRKTTDENHFDKEATYASNRVLRSSMVLDGHGMMVVDAVGDQTEIGHVARQATEISGIRTPLNAQLDRLSDRISRVSFVVALIVFVGCSIHGLMSYFSILQPGESADVLKIAEMMLYYFMIAVTLVVMAVPEGLPMAVTLSLALNMRRMLQTNNLVRKLHACETMGAITVICTDKTGTLTQNRMEVTDLKYNAEDKDLVYENMAVNSTAHLEQGEDGIGVGNPTECALLLKLKSEGTDYAELREKAHLVSQLTFSTERKYMASLVDSTATQGRVLYVKGAPEIVMKFCNLSEEQRKANEELLAQYQAAAMRTLAFAAIKVENENETDCRKLAEQGGLKLIGLTAIMDPVRPEVVPAISSCRQAGVKVKIVTGDTTGTAIEIARRIGLWNEEDSEASVITGSEFAALSDEDASKRVASIKIMSRARPADKQRLVKLLQDGGAVVAVTGDGTNDAPALNYAQVGLSMGSGTSVAKEASDITLMDDSFSSIATAVMWGRSLYKNIQRFIVFQMTICVTALAISMAGIFLDTEMPLTVTQILWINLIVDTFASLALSTIPPSVEVMKEKPRHTSDFIISKGLGQNILFTSLLFFIVLLGMLLYYDRWGTNSISDVELTKFFTFFVMLQFWNMLNASTLGSNRSAFSGLRSCRGLLLVLALILFGQILIVQMGGEVFRTVPLSLSEWLEIIALSSLALWIGEAVRFMKRKTAYARI